MLKSITVGSVPKRLGSIRTQHNEFTCYMLLVCMLTLCSVLGVLLPAFLKPSLKSPLVHSILCQVNKLVLAWRYPCVIWVGSNVFTTKCASAPLMSNCSEYSSRNYTATDDWGAALIWHNWLHLNHALHVIRTEWEINTDASGILGHMQCIKVATKWQTCLQRFSCSYGCFYIKTATNWMSSTGKNINLCFMCSTKSRSSKATIIQDIKVWTCLHLRTHVQQYLHEILF